MYFQLNLSKALERLIFRSITTFFMVLQRVNYLVCEDDCIYDFLSFNLARLFWRDEQGKQWIQMRGYNFGDDIVDEIVEGYQHEFV